MKFPHRKFVHLAAGAAAFTTMTASAAAQAPSLAGKNVQMIIGGGSGGTYDVWGRVVARHIGKHLPGKPTVVPQNMPGAGSLNAANHIYNVAPKDGTAIGLIQGPTALAPVTGAPGARFDPIRISWLGTPITETHICIAYNSPQVKVKTLEDLYDKELIVGSNSTGAGTSFFPKALSALLGMKFKVILGFPASIDVLLAMERGEVDGICQTLAGVSENRPDWIPGKKVAILFQGGAAPNPDLKDVPFINDLARNPEDRQAIEFLYAGLGLGRPFIAPPGMAPERVKMLRDAFSATMKDPDFLADAKKQKLGVNPTDGEQLAVLIKRIYATPKPIVDRVAKLIN
jgi:tripartite-type tricarboxylate transporter receptor subunit TctC